MPMTEYDDSMMESDSNIKRTTDDATGVREVAEAVDPVAEDTYWRNNYPKSDYAEENRSYKDYRPAYKYGWEARARLGDRPYTEIEAELENGWEKAKGESKLAWTQAKRATSDAWHRLERAVH
jgi:hypothetical protein